MALVPGDKVGPYEILGPLGKGGMEVVYRARDTRLRREVALNVVLDAAMRDPDSLARFERETRAVAALDHPNIVAIHDTGTHDGVPFAVTELLEGETLAERALFAISPDGTRLVYCAEVEGTRLLVLRDMDSLDTRVLPGTERFGATTGGGSSTGTGAG
jgi:serine/threonine protein kinase